MLWTLSLIAIAHAGPIEAQEFYETGYTLPKGELLIHPIAPSSYGLTDQITLQTSPLAWIGAPNLGVRYGLPGQEGSATSVSLGLAGSWDMSSVGASVGAAHTWGGKAEDSFSVEGAVSVTRVDLGDGATLVLGVPLTGDYLHPLNDRSWLRAYVNVDPWSIATTGAFTGSVGGDWTYGWDYLRLGLGLAVVDGRQVQVQIESVGGEADWVPAVLPVPTLALWWRID